MIHLIVRLMNICYIYPQHYEMFNINISLNDHTSIKLIDFHRVPRKVSSDQNVLISIENLSLYREFHMMSD